MGGRGVRKRALEVRGRTATVSEINPAFFWRLSSQEWAHNSPPFHPQHRAALLETSAVGRHGRNPELSTARPSQDSHSEFRIGDGQPRRPGNRWCLPPSTQGNPNLQYEHSPPRPGPHPGACMRPMMAAKRRSSASLLHRSTLSRRKWRQRAPPPPLFNT